MEIKGVQFRFIDTAGLRETEDVVERIGIERTIQKIKQARIVIWLLDAPPSHEEYEEMRELLKEKSLLIVHNKADKLDKASFVPYIEPLTMISAKHGEGITELKNRIYEEAQKAGLVGNPHEIIVSNLRHYDALLRSHESISHVIDGLSTQLSGDLIAEDLRLVLSDLGEITGENQITPQETLNNIFQHFCVGK